MLLRIGDVQLYFDTSGSSLVADGSHLRERPVVVLVPGGPGQDLSLFKPALDPLSDVAQLVYLDPRGCGRSERGDPGHWTLARWADDLARFVDALGIEHPVILGASFGGMVAMSYAAAHPGRPAGIVLAMTGLGMRPALASAAFRRLHGAEAADVHDGYWRPGGEGAFGQYMAVCMPLFARVHASGDELARSRLNVEMLERFWAGPLREVDLRDAASAIVCPTLVLAGELDPILPPEASDELFAALPAGVGRQHVLGGAGHSVRDLVAAGALPLIREFLLEIASTPLAASPDSAG